MAKAKSKAAKFVRVHWKGERKHAVDTGTMTTSSAQTAWFKPKKEPLFIIDVPNLNPMTSLCAIRIRHSNGRLVRKVYRSRQAAWAMLRRLEAAMKHGEVEVRYG